MSGNPGKECEYTKKAKAEAEVKVMGEEVLKIVNSKIGVKVSRSEHKEGMDWIFIRCVA